jgi:hypothetical protein
MFAGTWRIARSGEAATLTIDPFEPIPPAERIELQEEAARLLEFVGLDGAQIVVRAPTS